MATQIYRIETKLTILELSLELVDWEVLGPVPDIARDTRMSIGVRKRERGNKHFARGDYSTAVMCYR